MKLFSFKGTDYSLIFKFSLYITRTKKESPLPKVEPWFMKQK